MRVFGLWSRAPPHTSGSSTTFTLRVEISGHTGVSHAGRSCELRLPEGEGVDVRIVDASVGELYDEMAAAAGDGVLRVVGGGGVASQFADEGRLDEVRVTVGPPRAGRRQTASSSVDSRAARCS